jgi:putative transposase
VQREELRERCVQLSNCPTQAKTGLEWATSQPSKWAFLFACLEDVEGGPYKPAFGLCGTVFTRHRHRHSLWPILPFMPRGLTRFQNSGQSHFVTFCCYHRHKLFTSDASMGVFESALERVRRNFGLCVYAYVVMPDHVHLLLSEPERQTLADALKSLKQGVSRRLIGNAEHFWQKRYYDFNIRDYPQFVEKLRYIHRNPVRAGLCERPEDWGWSSFCHYATGSEGTVELESEWTARKRERAAGRLCPAIELPHSSQNRA